MKNFLLYLIKNHKFFKYGSNRYIGKFVYENYTPIFSDCRYGYRYKYSFKDKLYYPVAYIKYMIYRIKDYTEGMK